MATINLKQTIPDEYAGLRLDQALAKLFPQYSRSQMQQWVEEGAVTINGIAVHKNKERVFPSQIITIQTELQDQESWQAEAIPLDIIYEDDQVMVINKQAGLVVHPGAGNPKSTLVNALLNHADALKKIPRAGLIHRLDKDTSGLLLIAKTLEAQNYLTKQMQERKIERIYHAIVLGETRLSGTIDAPIGRHPQQRIKMAVLTMGGKHAITHYELLESFDAYSYLEVKLETGRTHQIRVHMAYVGHPLLGDPLYGRHAKHHHLPETLTQLISNFNRQALHAKKLAFQHPITHEIISLECPLPEDFEQLLQAFQEAVD